MSGSSWRTRADAPPNKGAADIMARMHPGDRQEAEHLAGILEPVLTPRVLAAIGT
jgi:hypothetical protein